MVYSFHILYIDADWRKKEIYTFGGQGLKLYVKTKNVAVLLTKPRLAFPDFITVIDKNV